MCLSGFDQKQTESKTINLDRLFVCVCGWVGGCGYVVLDGVGWLRVGLVFAGSNFDVT